MAIVTRFLAERNMNGNKVPYYALGVVAIALYMVVLYVNFWEKGASDKLKVDGGRMKLSLFHGLYISLIYNIPTVVFGIFATISCFVENGFLNIIGSISPLYNGMYSIFTDAQGLNLSAYLPPVFILLIIPSLIVSTISYILGVKGYKCLFPEPKKAQDNKTQ